MSSGIIAAILSFGNIILASVNVIIGFSLLAYILAHNYHSSVARAFCALMALTTIVYIVDISMTEVTAPRAANAWLRLQWVGIAFVPAAYFHFSDALLRTTGDISRWRRLGVMLTYSVGLIAFVMVAASDLIVDGVSQKADIYHLEAGPWFWLFAVYYLFTAASGWFNILRARERCLTSTSRRRMSYLMLAFIAPGIGAFPYLLIPTTAEYFSPTVISVLTLASNLGVALMTIVIGYIVAYQGVLLPDRVVKHNLIHYLLRGPLVAILVIIIMLALPKVEHILGLPRDMVMVVAVAGSVVLMQVVISVSKPAIDRLIYRQDRREIAWIQSLDQRLLTTADLEQLLENTLISLCDLLRTPSGFVVTMQGATPSIRVFCGRREAAASFLARAALRDILDGLERSRQDEFLANSDFVPADGHWLLPLRSRSDKATLGILGIANVSVAGADGSGEGVAFGEEDLEMVDGLVRRAEMALEDMRLQQQVFAALQGLGNELDQLQEWRSMPRYAGEQTLPIETAPAQASWFSQAVRDALSQFWGGPKLSSSPLLQMDLVHERRPANDNVPAKAVRSALQEAIEHLKPAGERSMTASEWIVYNILELKFVQGQRIRNIVQRLAISESDFYRKQRIAIEQVAETLLRMERDRQNRQNQTPDQR